MSAISLKIRVLGPPSVEYADGSPVEGLGLGKPLGMLAYIILKNEVRREELISLFWSDLPEEKARNAFRQTLHRLRKGLGDALITRGHASLAVESGGLLTVDLASFDAALQRSDFDTALELYKGPFLDGLELGEPDFDNWVLGERARLGARHQWALEQAISSASAAGNANLALARAGMLTSSAPLAAGAALTETSLLIAAGRTSEARTKLEQFSQRYRTEFAEEPPQEIRESLARLRKDSGISTGSAATPQARALIGREKEMARLLAAWTDTRGGNANLILVEGPDGIGKTALVEEFLARISKIGPLLPLVGRERSSGALLPYASIGQALRGVLAAPGLAGASQHLLAEAARLLPELHDHFDLPPVQNVDDETSQLRFFEGVAALIDAVAYEQPVCLVLDDFQSAASTTMRLVEYLYGRLASVAVTIVIVFRSSAVSGAKASSFPFVLRDKATGKRDATLSMQVTRVSIPPLEAADAEALARSVADADVLPSAECERIARLSGGVPFRILDLARQAAGGLLISALPATLQESLWARLQGCSPSQQRLFVASALIERPASIRLLASASHLSETAAFDAVMALETRGLLRQTHQGVAPEHHEAAQFALMGTGPAGRALLAGWAADALAAEPNRRSTELAHLYNLAGNNREAFKYAIAAAYEAAGLREEGSVRHFLDIAESAASTPADRMRIESIRRTFTPDHHRLLSGESVAIQDADLAPTLQSSQEVPASIVIPVSVRVLLTTLMRSTPVRIAGAVTLGVALALAGLTANRARSIKGTLLPDTLFVVSRSGQSPQLFFVSGRIVPGRSVAEAYSKSVMPSWRDSLALPYMNPVESPSGSMVAVERMRETGADILLFSAAGKPLREAAAGPGDDIIAGWSPDGEWLLATHGQNMANGNYDADLFAISADGTRRLALDTGSSRSVVEAAWSPDGTHIAWTARVGETHQQEVFVADADGRGLINISKSPEEDYHVEWANDGSRIAFTSNRFGNADIFAYVLGSRKLLRLTVDSGQDDYAAFSPDGNFVAYESTAEGISSVFVVRSWGGNPFRVAGGDQSFTVSRWGNPAPAKFYIASVRIAGPQQIPLGTRVGAAIEAVNVANIKVPAPAARWINLDPALADLSLKADEESLDTTVVMTGIKPGLARVVVSAGGWRADTATFRVGNSPIDLITDQFSNGVTGAHWLSVGDSVPKVLTIDGGREFSPRSGRLRENGVLSLARLPLYNGFFVRVAVRAPLREPTAQRSFSISLVAAQSGKPSPLKRLATIEWIGEAARLSYSVDRETWTEPLGMLKATDQHVFEMRIGEDGKVTFNVDGQQRWKSRLRIPGGTSPSRLWLGSKGSGDAVSFDNVRVGLDPVAVRR